MKINKVLAQEIVDKVMTVIPYNVNIMFLTNNDLLFIK